jgi:hypothetical protein
MTNLMVLVCLPAGPVRPETVAAELKPRLERYDRTRPVPPYRREFGVSLTEFAKRLAAIGRHDDADLDAMDLANRLTAWRFLAEHHNADLFEESERLYIDDDARPYTMSTANPGGHIDRWWIGGLWAGRFYAATTTEQGLICPARDGQRWCCAGGVLHALDLSGMRRDAATAAHAAYRRWQSTVAGTPPATPWQEYIERHHGDSGGYPLKTADDDFRAQPRVQALIGHDVYAGSAPRFGGPLYSYSSVVDEYQAGQQVYVTYRSRRAVLGYALLTLDGQWLAPGDVGRWATSTDTFADRLTYTELATAHLESLQPRCRLVGITCHG